jgi:predicted ribosomally synthesized peptide with SipW-like signal peptide
MKVLLSLAALGAAGAMAGLGTFATFTSTTAASEPVTAGTVTIALGTAGTATNRLTIPATGVVPGDTIQRVVDLVNTGNQDLSRITLTTSATTTSLLDTDATNGLHMIVERCTNAWTVLTSNPDTYSCPGSVVILTRRAVVGVTDVTELTNLNALTGNANATDHLRVTLDLPSSAPDSMQGLSSTIRYQFDAVQRTATDR